MRFSVGIILLVLLLTVSSAITRAQVLKDEENREKVSEIWEKIRPYFSPPEQYAGEYGTYQSPLAFYDGQPVTTRGQWQKRKKEIRQRWHELMGPWPSLLKNQQLEIIASRQREGFTEHRIRFNWMPDQETEGYLLVPAGQGPHPAVITVYYEPETAIGEGRPHRDFAYQLTKRGFVTMSLGTTRATEEKTYSLYYPNLEDARVEPLSMLAYAASNAWHVLAKRPEVDSTRIGIMGHSFGGKWAMFASTLFDKFAAAVWSDPGIVFEQSRPNINYWEPWYLGYHPPPWRERGIPTEDNPAKGLYPRLIEEGYDLHELHALMAPRPFLVSGGAEDPPKRWVPLNHTIAVNRLLGYENRVAMSNRPDHSPNSHSNEIAYLFFEYFLKYNEIISKNI
ncbi:prolyl oligopeptidase family serine peptidase [Fodinibius sediminis]|uniref:BAAT / Acyl-CoA thioester hydrolase C terminal n=1 Tax=Fodinibius sediminis TaxID=1214077 RepID=A0A521CTH4_9BACT|nr:prolyl oligopeptidase family serine peptidase [Fodinibius sediminis]SMO62715.1 BAAT / Acyl-CoA thioester hydrolase C terminal [Fodinibius sediminis]